MNTRILVVCLLALQLSFITSKSKAQGEEPKYPYTIHPGESKIVTPALGTDTLWVLKNSQVKNLVKEAKTGRISNEQLGLLNQSIATYKMKSQSQDSLTTIMKQDRDYYQNNWKKCDDNFQKMQKQLERQIFFKRLAFVGIGVALVGGFITGILIK